MKTRQEMSNQGYFPHQQHYVPPAQPTYVQQQHYDDGAHHRPHGSYGPGYPAINSHETGASYATVSSLGTGHSPPAVNHHVSGPGGGFAMDYGARATSGPQQQGTNYVPELGSSRCEPQTRLMERPIFEMPAEPAQPALGKGEQQEGIVGKGPASGATAPSASSQGPVQANPWPFYLDVSPTRSKEDGEESGKQEEVQRAEEEKELLQAVPWPYHGPTTEDDEPQATVHPPRKQKADAGNSSSGKTSEATDKDKLLPPCKDSQQNTTLSPAGEDESVLDDILAVMDAQDEDEGDNEEEKPEGQRPLKDPTLRPPPLNLSHPSTGDRTRPSMASGAVSPGGKTYIPYRPGATSSTTSPRTQSPPPQQQFNQVTAPHHVYMSHTQASLSPPPHPGASNSPHPGSPLSSGGFSPYRPPSPQAPLSTASTGLGIHSPHPAEPGSQLTGGEPLSFVAYEPSASQRPGGSASQTQSGLTSPNHPMSPAFPPPRKSPSPRPSASSQPGPILQPSHGSVVTFPTFDSSTLGTISPYPSSPPHGNASPSVNRPASPAHRNKTSSPAPLAFYPPPTTQPTHPQPDPVPGRLASPTAGTGLSRPSSRNDSASIHSGVSSTMGGAPVHPQTHGLQSRPSPTPGSGSSESQQSQYFTTQTQTVPQQQEPPPLSPTATSPYHVPQQTYNSPAAASPHSPASPYSPSQPSRPGIPHATTLPSPSPSPLSPPPPYTPIDLPPRPGSQPAAGSSYQGSQGYHQSQPPQASQFAPQPTYAPSQAYEHRPPPQHHQQQYHQQQSNQHPPPPPNLNQTLPPLPPRPSTSHNGRPPPPARPQGFGSTLPNATNFPPPPKPNYNGMPPPMPPRPTHQQHSYGNSNKIFGSASAKKWLDKTERLVEQTFGDILQPQVDQGYRPSGPPGGGSGGVYHHGPPQQGNHGLPPSQPQYAPPQGHGQHHPQHRPSPQHGPYPDLGRGRGRR